MKATGFKFRSSYLRACNVLRDVKPRIAAHSPSLDMFKRTTLFDTKKTKKGYVFDSGEISDKVRAELPKCGFHK